MTNKQELRTLDGDSEGDLFIKFDKFMEKNNIISFQLWEVPTDNSNPTWHWWRMWIVSTKKDKENLK